MLGFLRSYVHRINNKTSITRSSLLTHLYRDSPKAKQSQGHLRDRPTRRRLSDGEVLDGPECRPLGMKF
jgi:hypothetical protein